MVLKHHWMTINYHNNNKINLIKLSDIIIIANVSIKRLANTPWTGISHFYYGYWSDSERTPMTTLRLMTSAWVVVTGWNKLCMLLVKVVYRIANPKSTLNRQAVGGEEGRSLWDLLEGHRNRGVDPLGDYSVSPPGSAFEWNVNRNKDNKWWTGIFHKARRDWRIRSTCSYIIITVIIILVLRWGWISVPSTHLSNPNPHPVVCG